MNTVSVTPDAETSQPTGPAGAGAATEKKQLSPEALRALAEAEERRKLAASQTTPREIGGQAGPDPVRYGDWEKAGIVSDF